MIKPSKPDQYNFRLMIAGTEFFKIDSEIVTGFTFLWSLSFLGITSIAINVFAA